MIEINSLVKEYKTHGEIVRASDNISYKFEESGLYFILGKSGCGKTTLLNILSGLDTYDAGDVIVNGCNISKLTDKELDEYRNIHIGIVFQDFNLLSDMNVYDNLRIVLKLQGGPEGNQTCNETEDRDIKKILADVGLQGYEKRKICELSGGERQRIAIARCILKKTKVIYADEPTGNLDKKSGECVLELLKEISKTRLVIVVSHDKEAAYKYGDKIINMSDGKIIGEEQGQDIYLYSFCIEQDNNTPLKFENLDRNKMIDIISGYINDMSGADELLLKNVKKTENDVQNHIKPKTNDIEAKTEAQRLSLKYKLRLSYEFLKKRKIRFAFTTILLALTCVLFYFSLYISFYDKNRIIVKYMDENDTVILPSSSTFSYKDDFYNDVERQVSKGRFLFDVMTTQLAKYGSINRVLFDQMIEHDELAMYRATLFFVDENMEYPSLVQGVIPQNNNEIVISDYISYILGIGLYDELLYENTKLKVAGIYKTDYKEIGLKSKLNYGYSEPFFDFDCMYKYFGIYISKEYLNVCKDSVEGIEFRAGNFMLDKNKTLYLDSYISVSDARFITQDELLEGRMPEKYNEILISEGFANDYNLMNGVYQQMEFNFIDIYDDSYKNTYADMMNLYDYYKDGIKIVGVVRYSPERVQKDMYVHSDIWRDIVDNYYDYYYGEYVFGADSNYYKEIVENADNSKIYFNEPAINNIIKFDNLIIDIKPILYLILVICISINFIMIATFISISINENKKSIGILRSLGVKMKECTHIFTFEFIIIYIMSIIIAGIIIINIISMVNSLYMENLRDVKYCIIDKSYIVYTIICFVEILINTLCIRIPIKSLSKKKPIEIIRN